MAPEVAKRVAAYMELPYTFCLYHDDEVEPLWMAYVEEFEGCMSHGSTPEEAMDMVREAMELWLEGSIEEGWEIPLPKDHFPEHSGKFQVRLPVGLHGKLASVAKDQQVSLNQLVTAILAEGVGWRPAGERTSPRT
jgi:predicted RNase H-like HicB family nuclease